MAFGPTGTRLRSFPDSSPPFQPRLRSAFWFASLANYGGGKPTLALPSHHLRRPFGGAFLFECCFRAPRPSEVPGSPFKRRSAPRGAPCGALICPSGGPGHVCGVTRTLPRPLPRALALGIALALATARAFMYASLPLGSIDLPPAYVSRQGPPRNLAQLARASGGGCGARRLAPSRRLLDARPAGGASAISRSKRRLHSACANRFSILGRGAGPRADTRKEPT